MGFRPSVSLPTPTRTCFKAGNAEKTAFKKQSLVVGRQENLVCHDSFYGLRRNGF